VIINKERMAALQGCASCSREFLFYEHEEKICYECEVKAHPERFKGCAFCRKPIQDICVCHVCKIGFRRWILEHVIFTKTPDNYEEYIRSISFNSNVSFDINHIECDKWPGFYIGDNKWEIPDWNIYHDGMMKEDEIYKILGDIFEENGIYVCENIQLRYAMPAKFIDNSDKVQNN